MMNLNTSNGNTFGLLFNAVTGEKYMVSANKEFIIGRSFTCSLIIDEIYISRRHCIIKNENDQFIIYDNNTCSGTFLNCVQIPKGKNNCIVLKHGDLIAFGVKGKLEFIYRFSLSSNAEKRPKIENYKKEDSALEIIKLDDNYNKFLTELKSNILILKVEHLEFSNTATTQISEFQIMLNVALEWANKLSTEIMKHKYCVQDFNKNITEFHSTLILPQDNTNIKKPPIESTKNQVSENILLDHVYKEVITKVPESNLEIMDELQSSPPMSFINEPSDFCIPLSEITTQYNKPSDFCIPLSEITTQYNKHHFSTSSFIHKPITIQTFKMIDQQLVKMLVKEYHPFRIIEDKEFKHLVKMLCPNYVLPTRKTLTDNLLPQMYEIICKRMKNKLKNVSAVCLTIECWNSLKNQCFITLTVHIIDPQNESQLSSILIGCNIFDEEFTDDSLALFLKNTVDEWNLSNKLTGVISNNSVKIKAAIIKCNWYYLSCFTNTINLVGQSCLKSIELVIYKIKEIVMYFKNSSHALIKLTKFQKKTGLSSLKLKLDYPTCWKTTYDMINSIIQLKEPITATLVSLNTNLDIPSSQEWIIVEYARDILKMFYNVAMELNSEKYVSISKELIFVKAMNKYILKFVNNNMLPIEIQSMATMLYQDLISKFRNIEENILVTQATLLDPRFKKFGFSDEEKYNAALKYLKTEVHNITINQDESQKIQQRVLLNTSNSTIWEEFDKAVNITIGSNQLVTETVEVDNYLNEPLVNRLENPLVWWAERKKLYPRLYELVQRRLCVIASIVPCEKIFSKADQLVNEEKNRLLSNTISQILFLNQNM